MTFFHPNTVILAEDTSIVRTDKKDKGMNSVALIGGGLAATMSKGYKLTPYNKTN
jgi:hypothetical protein